MKTIRIGTFETNSSSTHSLTMCMKDEYEAWTRGEIYFSRARGVFVNNDEKDKIIRELYLMEKIQCDYKNKTLSYNGKTIQYNTHEERNEARNSFLTEEILDAITDEEIEKFYKESFDTYEFPLSYDEYCENIEFETYCEEFKTPNGEIVVGFGYYGQDY